MGVGSSAAMFSIDFCLRCDTQTAGEAYCSQRCRLQDMDSNTSSSAASSDSPYGYCGSNPSGAGGFYLPPAFDFSAYRHHSTSSASTSSTTASSRRLSSSSSSTRRAGSASAASSRPSSLYSLTGTSAPASSGTTRPGHERTSSSLSSCVTPSSSQASLLSFSSSSGGRGMSRQARAELRDYTKSFDQVRDLRRRLAYP